MTTHITKTDKFNEKIIDHDIAEKKVFYNLYNNSIVEPLHKFWFYIENAKVINKYSSERGESFRFALNNKTDNVIKFTEYIKNIIEYVKNIISSSTINIEYPWKEYVHYPTLISLMSNQDTKYLNNVGEIIDVKGVEKDKTYSLMIELTYMQLVKIVQEDISCTTDNLKCRLTLLVMQENKFDKITYFKDLNKPSGYMSSMPEMVSYTDAPKKIYNPSAFAFSSDLLKDLNKSKNNLETFDDRQGTYVSSSTSCVINPSSLNSRGPGLSNSGPVRLSLNPSDLLKTLNSLNKVSKVSDKKEKETDTKTIMEDSYIEQKNNLKKVEVEEKHLLSYLKKEHLSKQELLGEPKQNQDEKKTKKIKKNKHKHKHLDN